MTTDDSGVEATNVRLHVHSLVPWLIVPMLFSASCADSSSPPSPLLVGSWGGEHAGLLVTPDGGALEYDCASGRITEPLRRGRGGILVAEGTHTSAHGGPVRVDESPPRRPASYTGRLEGNTLTLTVVMTDSNTTVGTFQLTRGRPPHVVKCL